MPETPDNPTPDAGGGPVDALERAMSNAPDQAMQGLTQAMSRVQEMWQNAVQAMQQAFERSGDGAAMLAPYVGDAVAHLPEVGF